MRTISDVHIFKNHKLSLMRNNEKINREKKFDKFMQRFVGVSFLKVLLPQGTMLKKTKTT